MKSPTRCALALAALLGLLAGCETTPTTPAGTAPVETRSTPAAGTTAAPGAATATGVSQSRVATVDTAGAKTAPVSPTAGAGAATAVMAAPRERIVFFDFDSYVIKDEFKGLLDGQAKSLAANRGKRMTIEGHTDERGGREYNLALGQRRAEAVLRSLALLGASAEQLEAVSFGEERPLAQGSDEAAWSRNRRAELKDR